MGNENPSAPTRKERLIAEAEAWGASADVHRLAMQITPNMANLLQRCCEWELQGHADGVRVYGWESTATALARRSLAKRHKGRGGRSEIVPTLLGKQVDDYRRAREWFPHRNPNLKC